MTPDQPHRLTRAGQGAQPRRPRGQRRSRRREGPPRPLPSPRHRLGQGFAQEGRRRQGGGGGPARLPGRRLGLRPRTAPTTRGRKTGRRRGAARVSLRGREAGGAGAAAPGGRRRRRHGSLLTLVRQLIELRHLERAAPLFQRLPGAVHSGGGDGALREAALPRGDGARGRGGRLRGAATGVRRRRRRGRGGGRRGRGGRGGERGFAPVRSGARRRRAAPVTETAGAPRGPAGSWRDEGAGWLPLRGR